MIVSLSGVDGSGKTTVAKEIQRLLAHTGVEVVYRHEYNYLILKHLFQIIGRKRLEVARSSFLSTSSRKTALDRLWPYFVFVDTSLLVLWLKLTKRKSIVILDRFFYDQLVSFEGLGVASKQVEWLYTRGPKPDLAVVLSVSPEIAYYRKIKTHSYAIDFYRIGNERYQRISDQLRLPTMDTSAPLSMVSGQMLELIFSNERLAKLLVAKAANNRVIYKILSEYDLGNPYLEAAAQTYAHKVAMLQKTLDFVKKLLAEDGIEWLLFKSYMPFPHVPTYDVDILIRPSDKPRVLENLQSSKVPHREEELDKINIRLPNLYPISIHFGATWEGVNYASTEVLWRDVQEIVWHGCSLKAPGPTAEILTHAAHIFFELSFIRLSDALYLSELMSKDVNWKSLLQETERYNWTTAFILVNSLVERIASRNLEQRIKLPYPIPYGYIVKTFLQIISEDLKRDTFSLNKAKEYAREMARYALWRVGAMILGRAPFGEILQET